MAEEHKLPKEFLDYANDYPWVRINNLQKFKIKEWRNPETRAFLDKAMPNASDNEKFEAVSQISNPKAEEASKSELMEMRKKYRRFNIH